MTSEKKTLDFQELKLSDSFDTARISKHFKDLYGNVFVYVNNQLYYFNGVYWAQDNKKSSFLNNFICSEYYELLSNVLNDLTIQNTKEKNIDIKTNNDCKLKKMRDQVSRLLNHKKREDYIKDIICKLTNDDIRFDENPDLFAFKNKIFDLKQNKFVDPEPSQYISFTTGYDYEEPTEDTINELDNFIDIIFTQPELKHLYLTILSTGLEGKNLEKFVLANGGGGNGKGVLNELTKLMLGDYCYVLPSNVLLGPLKTGPNPEIANMKNRRLVFCREPDIDFKINAATMKELTGGEEINARLNHSNDTKTILNCTLIMECNEKPKLSEVSAAVARRIIDIPFKTTFVEDKIYNTLEPEQRINIFIGNPYYKSKEFKEKHKLSLFHILMKKYNEYITNNSNLPITDEIIKRNKEYLESSDDIGEWINDNYTKTGDKKDRIKLKSLFEHFKQSDHFKNLPRKNQNMLTYKSFQSKLQGNIFFKFSIEVNNHGTYEFRGYKKAECDFNDEDDYEEPKSKLDF